jgi:site-specific DNA recombinase
MVEDGLAELDDILKDRITALKADRDTAQAALDRAQGTNRSPITIPINKITAFSQLIRERLTTGETPFRKAYLGAIIDRVEVDDHQIRILGRKDVLEQAVLTNGGPIPGVRSFVRRWRTRQDSNL